ncbi:MAG: hypothetical protein KGZ37_01080 [Nitrosarchaeum sp.]|nr:hypothetical protein [Nitrosarchaeum sp.]
MEIVKSKLVLILSMILFLLACKEHKSISVVLHYDFYQDDTIVPNRTLRIKYEQREKRDFSKVTISSGDSTLAVFYEKISDSGILRSLDTFEFKLSHSFSPNKEVELKLEKSMPYFLNVLTKNYRTKILSIDENDSSEVIFFDEAIPWHSYTCSYYLRKRNLFLIFYNCYVEDGEQYKMSQNCYYKLSTVQGLDIDMNYLNRVSDKIISDTLFFAKYHKFPSKIPLPPTE